MSPRALLPVLFCIAGAVAAFPAEIPARERMVVVISLDGFPAYSLDDPKLPVPTLRKLIRNGVSARMTTVNPTVTWPNHTAMVTGVRADRHTLLANGTITRTGSWPPIKVEPMIEKTRMVPVPTVYDAAHRAGLTTAQVDWVAIEKAPTITWAFREWASASDGPLEQEMIRKGALTPADVEAFSRSNILFRDQVWTTAGAYLIREHKPNLLLFHLLSLDSTHHQYGPRTLAGNGAMAFLDSCVARLVEAVQAAGMMDRTTFLVVSDHGFKRYTKQVKPAVALAAAGLDRQAYVLPEGGTAYVYLADRNAPASAAKVAAALRGIEGIDRVIGPEGFAALGLAQPGPDAPQMYDLLLTAQDGYSFSGATGGPVTAEVPQQAGSHGYLASDPEMDAIFIASGYGITPGRRLDRIDNIDLASTIAQLLGVSLPTAAGKPIPLQ